MGAFDLLAKGASKGAKKAAPFFSKADVVLDELQRNKGTGQEFLTEIIKKGAKPTELKERGIEKALKDAPKMTKAEVQKVFEQKAPPKVQEKVLTSDAPDYDEFLEAKAQELYGVDYFDLRKDEKAKIDKMFNDMPLTQYDKHKTPGGENYREILLKLPAVDTKRIMELEADIRRSDEFYRNPASMSDYQAKVAELEQLKQQQAAAGKPYTSGHYKQDPNLLAHIRVQDFKTPDGKKVLLVDEIQSDWHQAARDLRGKEIKRIMKETGVDKKTASAQVPDDFGYGDQLRSGWKFKTLENGEVAVYGPDMQAPYGVTSGGASNAQSEAFKIADKYGGVMTSTVPNAPFKKNWHELSMKRVLDYAAENGYDSVAITPGKTQIDRYEEALRKNLDSLEYEPYMDEGGKQMFEVAGFKNGDQVFSEEGITPERLQELIGKDTAQKISEGFGESLAQERPMRPEWMRIQSGDLSVGGEGMKGFYDKILPDYLNNYGKKYGAQMGEIQLQTGQEMGRGPNGSDMIPSYSPTMQRFHSFDITPQMREEITTKGQPMYGKVAMPALEGLAAGTGAATMAPEVFNANNEQQVQNPVHFTENPDAMLLELMQRN
jgi:hypothetical protein